MTAANDPEHISDYERGQRDRVNRVIYRPGNSDEYRQGYEAQFWEEFKNTIEKAEGWR